MGIKDSHSVLCELIVSKDALGIEKFLLYSDNRDSMLEFACKIAGKNKLQEISENFISKALRDNVSNIIS